MAATLNPQLLLYALLGGILPAILWLWFWLHEDAQKPEPRGLILLSFLAGMAAVLVVIPIEKLFLNFYAANSFELLFSWATIEEIVKYGTIAFVALTSRFFDEPIDALIYMITVALGFSALENSLFLIEPLAKGNAIAGFLTGNLRFLGASLLHVAASASVGVALGLSFYRGIVVRTMSVLFGLAGAIALHTLFNFFIIRNNGKDIVFVFAVLWLVVVAIIYAFERVKRVRAKN